MNANHENPSAWLVRHAPLIRAGGVVLDLACGIGRNARWLAQQGWRVEAVDRDSSLLDGLRQVSAIRPCVADLEHGAWPYPGRTFDGIVVCRYLHRPLLPMLADCLAPEGVLIYETFMAGQEAVGRPRNPDFLLRPDELLEVFAPLLRVVAFEQGVETDPHPAFMQRICAKRENIVIPY